MSFAIEKGDDREIRSAASRMTPALWADGLALPAQVALDQARRAGVPPAEEALSDILERGPRSTVAKAIVRRLACDLPVRARKDRSREGVGPMTLA